MICEDTCKGLLKIALLVLGLITVGLTATSYADMWREETETLYLSICILMFVTSLLSDLLCFGVETIRNSDSVKTVDLIFHIAGGLVLVVVSIIWFIVIHGEDYLTTIVGGRVVYIGVVTGPRHTVGFSQLCRSSGIADVDTYLKRVFAGVFGLLNGILYVIVGCLLATRRNRRH